MTGMSVTCARFDESLEELALGHVDEPERSLLLGHAASCVACRARLETTAAVGDRLLPLAPQHEPPAGFETRVLAQLASVERAPARRSRWWLPALAAAALVLGAILGGVVGRGTGGGSGGDAARGPAVVDYRSGSGNRGSDAKSSGTCCRTTRARVCEMRRSILSMLSRVCWRLVLKTGTRRAARLSARCHMSPANSTGPLLSVTSSTVWPGVWPGA